jgi:(p)ppGpp synthase/HD superfamily hydrolase
MNETTKHLPALALDIAYEAHANQSRKAFNLPYIVHPCSVASRLAPLGDDILIAVAFLHDVVEDSLENKKNLYIQKIDALGFNILEYVMELTYSKENGSKEDYMKSFIDKSNYARIVKIFDRLDNIHSFQLAGDFKYARIYAKKAQPLIDFVTNSTEFDNYLDTEYNRNRYFIDNAVSEINKIAS